MKKTGRGQKKMGKSLSLLEVFKTRRKPSIQMERRPSANQSDNLWRNYKNLLYLESARDEILRGVHRELAEVEGQGTNREIKIRKESFQALGPESNCMFEQIRSVFLRLPALATYDRHLLETSIKIVDNEERRDHASTANGTQTDGPLVSVGRPKGWRGKCLDTIKSEVRKRAAQTAPSHDLEEDKDGSRLLLRLVKARDDILKDLEHAKALSQLFTEEWGMYSVYAMTYYENVMSQMQDRFSFGLNHRETVQVLSWMIYCRDRVFNCQNSDCKPCQMIVQLQDKFLRETGHHIHEWMESALKRDMNDWQSDERPTADRTGALYSQFPVDILQMLEENMTQAKHISPALYGQIVKLCLEELDAIMDCYTASAKSYIRQDPPQGGKGHYHRASPTHAQHLRHGARKGSKETRPTHFQKYVVALLNNFDRITGRLREMTTEVGEAQKQMCEDCTNNNNPQPDEEPMHKLVLKIEAQMEQCSQLLLPKLQSDISSELTTLLTRNWLNGNGREAVDTMCDLMTSYLRHLREPVRRRLMPEIEELLVVAYIKGLTDKRITLEGKTRERLTVYDKICRECQQLEKFLQEFGAANGQVSCWEVVRELAGLVQVDDQQTIHTDLIVLANKYPDITVKQARHVLKMRGDFTKAQVKTIVSSSLGKKRRSVKGEQKVTIFSKLGRKGSVR